MLNSVILGLYGLIGKTVQRKCLQGSDRLDMWPTGFRHPGTYQAGGIQSDCLGEERLHAFSRYPTELRDAIARFYAELYGARYDPGTEVLVTPGAKQGLMYILQLLIYPGDDVLLFKPCWLSYGDMILLCGGGI